MNIIRKLPGPLLVFLGACSLSFGGLIVKSFEGATLWQILFWRTVFFLIIISLYLIITYKKQVFRSFYNLGFPGFIGGFILSFGFCGTFLRCITLLLQMLISLFKLKQSF